MARRASLGLLLALAAVGTLGACAKSSPAGPLAPDMSGRTICPDNPALCDGTCCGNECVATKVDIHNCGGCNVQCQSGLVCQNGGCGCLPSGMPCDSGQTCCGTGGCKDLMADVNNCGGCGKTCGTGSTCEAGVCKCGMVACAMGETCCSGTCAATCTSAPDMAMPAACACPSGCPLSKQCVGPNCCFEDVFFGKCMPDPICAASMM